VTDPKEHDKMESTITVEVTEKNVPLILIQLVEELKQMRNEQNRMAAILEEHSKCLEVFKFSRCTLIPWLQRNKSVILTLLLIGSMWISALDWINRWLQCAFFPPI